MPGFECIVPGKTTPLPVSMQTFYELAASRRAWIESVLIPWCRRASAADLRAAEAMWPDLAGRVAPEYTLWIWAWGRFPGLVIPDLDRLDEAAEIRVTLKDGRTVTGFPDARRSRSELVLVPRRGEESPPIGLDEVQSIERVR